MASINTKPRLRIVCEGPASRNLKFYDADGNEVPKGCVRSVTFHADCQQVNRITLDLVYAAVDAVGLAEVRSEGPLGGTHDAETEALARTYSAGREYMAECAESRRIPTWLGMAEYVKKQTP